MTENALISDQFYNWSDNEQFRSHSHATPATPGFGQATRAARTVRSPRFLDRTLQTLWQTGLQVRPRPRSWPQVLFVGQPARCPPRDGLRPGRVLSTSFRIPPQLSASASVARTDLQHQSRVITASGEVLTLSEHGAFSTIPPRSRYGRDARRQLSAKLVASRRGPRTSSCTEPS
jgi:hypothetical protein